MGHDILDGYMRIKQKGGARTVECVETTGEMFLNFRICLRESLMWVSITWSLVNFDVAERGAEGGKGLEIKRARRALTGHKYILSSRGN